MCRKTKGEPESCKATQSYQKACDANDIWCRHVAIAYFYGRGVPRDKAMAAQHFARSGGSACVDKTLLAPGVRYARRKGFSASMTLISGTRSCEGGELDGAVEGWLVSVEA